MCLLCLGLRLCKTTARKCVRSIVLCTHTAHNYKSKPHGKTTSPLYDTYPHFLPAILSLSVAAHLILKLLLAWAKKYGANRSLHQYITSSYFQQLKFITSIKEAGFYKSNLQMMRSSFCELLLHLQQKTEQYQEQPD